MDKTVFHIAHMDCAAEETLVRMQLQEDPAVHGLAFDLPQRRLTVYHLGELPRITQQLNALHLQSSVVHSATAPEAPLPAPQGNPEARLLWAVLLINGAFFLLEVLAGYVANSMGLLADSLDMLADALVYGLSLWAVGSSALRKRSVARASGYFQLVLAGLGMAEVLRRFGGYETTPDFRLMLGVSALALLANAACLYLLQQSRTRGEAHMQASIIFTSNDVLINLGVMAGAVLVRVFNSNLPDLLIGAVVFALVLRGAVRILQLAKPAATK
ncbi:cation transporter [Hymenobacter latericus]|uniref:cation transporter n=1 Tax=Hymenobacter sp. YIM 151858-1 TaxID=2987688 RepID=UPI002226CBBF|nr:cation transporter [Hymenobacter sp. YIM 151858-1]UYZ59497.1 cation transporter [Hymenobacter sp. YIM 151858-1]